MADYTLFLFSERMEPVIRIQVPVPSVYSKRRFTQCVYNRVALFVTPASDRFVFGNRAGKWQLMR